MLGEAWGLPWKQGRRALHDRISGTYTIDASQPFAPTSLEQNQRGQSQWLETDEEAAIKSIVVTPEPSQQYNLWQRVRQNSSLTLVGVALLSMIAVLVALVSTQIYIQNQQNQRATQQRNSQQFLALVKQLNSNGATQEQRRSAILALGTLNNSQAIQYLSNLLVKETDPIRQDTIQQALVSVGPLAIPNLKRINQLLAKDVESTSISPQQRELRQQQLQTNQRTLNKILAVSSSQINGIDLSRVQLGQSGFGQNSFNLILDRVDLSGVNFRFAYLNQASFKGSRFRGPGEDGRLDTDDDWIADLSFAQMKQVNLTYANLSRVLMNRTDLSRSILNKANLSDARLINANLSSAQLAGADLRNAVLENAILTGADLSEAKLNEAELYGASLGRVTAIGTQLSFANLTNTDWQGADLSGAYLDGANLRNAKLTATRLNGAILRSANLENANLQNTDLSLADLRGANLAGADFQGAILSPNKQDPTDQFVQTPAVGTQSALVQGVDFGRVKNLDPRQLAYICTQGGIHPRCP